MEEVYEEKEVESTSTSRIVRFLQLSDARNTQKQIKESLTSNDKIYTNRVEKLTYALET